MGVIIIAGSMFARKDDYMLTMLNHKEREGKRAALIESEIAYTYKNPEFIRAKLSPYESFLEQIEKTPLLNDKTRALGIKNGHLFHEDIVEAIKTLSEKNKIDIICTVTNLDFNGNPSKFINSERTINDLLTLPNVNRLYLHGKCNYIENGKQCGNIAQFSKRLVDDNRYILIDKEAYAPRCRKHFDIKEQISKKDFLSDIYVDYEGNLNERRVRY